jgi:pimeloyl-ACP methyl ester carboxylesterase
MSAEPANAAQGSGTNSTRNRQLRVNGVTLAVRESGQGVPIVLVHANVSDQRSWDSIESRLAEQFRVITYSRRYAWPNEPLSSGDIESLEVHADDLEALIIELGISPVHVVGNSAGGYITLLLARRKPELFRTLTLEESPAFTVFSPSIPPSIMQALTLLFTRPSAFWSLLCLGLWAMFPAMSAFKRGDNERGLKIFAQGVLGEKFFTKLSDSRYRQMMDNMAPHRQMIIRKNFPQFQAEDARAITTPVLMLTGEFSPRYMRAVDERLAELIPGAQHHLIPNASHFMHEDNPNFTLDEILKFTARHE